MLTHERTGETKWLAENRGAYANQWVALDGDRLIAAGTDPLKGFAAAKAEGIEIPFVVHVLAEDSLRSFPSFELIRHSFAA